MATIKDISIGSIDRVANTASTPLLNAYGVESLTVGNRHFAYVAAYGKDAISIFELDQDGELTFKTAVSDQVHTALNGVTGFATATFGSNQYLYASGALDSGITTFKVAADGNLTAVQTVFDDATLEIAGNEGPMTTFAVGGTQFLVAPGFNDDGISIFRLNADGSLTNTDNVTDDATRELDGAMATATAEVDGNTFVFVGGFLDDGLSSFKVDAAGKLSVAATVPNGGVLELDGVASLATAKVGNQTYLFASGSVSDGISVFSVSSSGELSNVFNISNNGALNGAWGLSVFEFGGEQFLAVNGSATRAISYHRIEAHGSLTEVDSFSVPTGQGFADARINDFIEIGGAGFIVSAGFDGHNVHTFGIGSGDSALGGTSDADTMFGYGGADTLNGISGDDRLDGGTGADILAGGKGNDFYIVDNQGDVIVETVGNGTADRVAARAAFALSADDDIELLTTTNSTGTASIGLTGNLLFQEVIGNAGNNVLSSGGAGGAADVMRGLGGNDTYRIYNPGDTILEGAAQGALDRLASAVDYVLASSVHVEVMTTNGSTGTSKIDLTGNAFTQEIIGNAGDNILHDGGPGAADTLNGLGGNDTYRVFNAGDTIFEAAGNGNDRAVTSVSFLLTAGAEVETVQTTSTVGTGAINLTGNEFGQSILGNAGSNRLEGKGGADKLYGLEGLDTFVFATILGAGNIDTIADFVSADDRFLMSKAIFKALTQSGTILATQFRANSTGEAEDANDFILQDTDSGRLYYDADGSGVGERVHFATVGAGVTMTNADFVIA